jgi:glycosyltransferase involved in cell wall biosynthesis
MRIAWVSVYNAQDPVSYGGRGYYAPLSLKRQSISVEYMGPFQLPAPLRLRRKLLHVRHHLLRENRFTKPNDRRWYSRDDAPFIHKHYARQISSKLRELENVDVVCSGVNPCVQPVSYLDCKQPIVIWADTTYVSAIDFYPKYFRDCICPESIRDIIANETSLLNRCRLAIYSSEWGARNAIEYYKIDPARVKVVPFGANLECNRTLDDIKVLVNSRPRDNCRLLFVGTDWLRKGGNVAVQTASELNKAGLPTELTVVGCDPAVNEPLPDFVRCLGYISNATEGGSSFLSKLFGQSHFLIAPSLAESYGHVFCEASSFAVPSLATNVGGIPTVVRNNENGRLFPLGAGAAEYCEYVARLFDDYSQYEALALSSFHEYESSVNWNVAGKAVADLLAELVYSG